MKVTAIIVAGGSGSRMGRGINKAFLPILGKTIIEHTLEAFFKAPSVEDIIIVTRKEDISTCLELFENPQKPVKVVEGGTTRQQSVWCGLKEADGGIVAIHDAARALIEWESIEKTIMECEKFGGAALGVACVDTLKRADSDGFIGETIDRENVYRIQTPQTFYTDEIKKAHERAQSDGFQGTDDCALYEKYIGKVKIIPGSDRNIKITFGEDLIIAEALLAEREKEI